MDNVLCNCAECDQRLGKFVNSWTKIGKSYISPVIDNENSLNVVSVGTMRLGEEQTLVEDCRLQDVACIKCHAVVGLRCLDTPVNHVLHRGQLFIRISSVTVVTPNGDCTEVTIQRTLKLKVASHNRPTAADMPTASESSARASINNDGPSKIQGHLLDHLQDQLESQSEEIQKLNRAGYQMASSFDNAVLRIEGEVRKLREGMAELHEHLKNHQSKDTSMKSDISSLRGEIGELKKTSQDSSVYTGLEQEIASAKQTIANVRLSLRDDLNKSTKEQQQKHDALISDLNCARHDLKLLRQELDGAKETTKQNVSAAKAYTKEVVSLRTELKELKEQLAQEKAHKSLPKAPVFPTREIDILTTNITKIGQRASQVETLQMELELLKGRIQRMERAETPSSPDAPDVETQHTSPVDSLPSSSRRKRKRSPQPKDSPKLGNSSATTSRKNIIQPSQFSPLANASIPDSPRLTKSGTVDKRSLRKSLRRAAVQDRSSNS